MSRVKVAGGIFTRFFEKTIGCVCKLTVVSPDSRFLRAGQFTRAKSSIARSENPKKEMSLSLTDRVKETSLWA